MEDSDCMHSLLWNCYQYRQIHKMARNPKVKTMEKTFNTELKPINKKKLLKAFDRIRKENKIMLKRNRTDDHIRAGQ